jgi:hypothetical protein
VGPEVWPGESQGVGPNVVLGWTWCGPRCWACCGSLNLPSWASLQDGRSLLGWARFKTQRSTGGCTGELGPGVGQAVEPGLGWGVGPCVGSVVGPAVGPPVGHGVGPVEDSRVDRGVTLLLPAGFTLSWTICSSWTWCRPRSWASCCCQKERAKREITAVASRIHT